METAENMEKIEQLSDKQLENVVGGAGDLNATPPYTAIICSPDGKSVCIHRVPGLECSSVCRVNVGDSVTVLELTSRFWYRVEFNGKTGYIQSAYLRN